MLELDCLSFFLPKDKYFTLTMERGVLFIRSNLLEDAMTDNKRVSPVKSIFFYFSLKFTLLNCTFF